MPSFPRSIRFTHLKSAVTMTGPHGMCFHRSAALCLDLPGSELVVGIFRAATDEEVAAHAAMGLEASREPFIHAWVEWRGMVFAPTTLERTGGQLVAMEPEAYYGVNDATGIRRVPRPALLRISGATGLSAHLRKSAPLKGSFVEAILNEAGIAFMATPTGGILPAEEAVDG